MTDRVRAGERGVIRLYRVDLPQAEAAKLTLQDLADALGVDRLDPDQVVRIAPGDLAGIGLRGYLEAGYDIPAAGIDPALAGQDGPLLLVRSPAFDGPVELSPRPPLSPLARLEEPGLRLDAPAMPEVESARPGTAPPPEPEPEAETGAQAPDEAVRERFPPDRETYIRDHLILAAVGMVGATFVLYLLGNADPWIGAIAALLAIAVRGAYLLSEEMGQVWVLTDTAMRGPGGRRAPLSAITDVRRVGSAVQIVTRSGDKYLMKFQADPKRVRARIRSAAGLPG